MFDSKSDYALNKRDTEAIVCRNANGVVVRLTRENFDSDDEFIKWKEWSDQDYYDTYKAGRGYYDNCVQLDEATDTPCQSAEETLLTSIQKMELDKNRAAVLKLLRYKLTDRQYRRLWMYYIEKKTEAEIAAKEGVGQRRISTSISSGKRIVEKILRKNFDNRG